MSNEAKAILLVLVLFVFILIPFFGFLTGKDISGASILTWFTMLLTNIQEEIRKK